VSINIQGKGFTGWCTVKRGKNDILTDLRTLLRYHGAIGIRHYPRSEAVGSFLAVLPRSAGKLQPDRKGGVPVVSRGRSTRQKDLVAVGRSPVTIAEIGAEVATCQACELHKKRIYPVAGRGPEKVRLLIVGDWLSADERGNLPPGHLFGVEQDQMLGRMLLAINLSATEVFITNVIKCAVPASCQPQATHVRSCFSFLRRQISVLDPELIITMGSVAARAVLAKSQPLSQLRGRFYDYVLEENRTIPVIATYHPSYLLQNPEMKQATWLDLQLLAKKLDLL